MAEKKHVMVPPDTRVYICAYCGAVAREKDKICKVQGMGTKADWCGIKGTKPPKFCQNKANNDRWQCQKCGETALNPELLCEPEKMMVPE
jgi:hypothetical protein